MVDARLPDGSRVNVVIPPLAVDGPILSIRRFGSTPLTAEDLLRNRMLTPPMLEVLKGAVKARLNIVVSGGTGRGQDDAAECAVRVHLAERSALSRSKTRPNCR